MNRYPMTLTLQLWRFCNQALIAISVMATFLFLSPQAAFADFAIIVNRNSPVSSLTEDDVRQIFLGRMRLFPSTQHNVEPVDIDASIPLFHAFYRTTAHLTPQALERLRSMYLFSGKGTLPKMVGDEAAVIAFVATHIDAIGYIDATHTTKEIKNVLIIKAK